MAEEKWYPPTIADLYGIEYSAGTMLKCPSCGRRVPPDMLFDMTKVPMDEACVARIQGSGLACDACKATLHREGLLRREDYAIAVEAPAELITKARLVDEINGLPAKEDPADQ